MKQLNFLLVLASFNLFAHESCRDWQASDAQKALTIGNASAHDMVIRGIFG